MIIDKHSTFSEAQAVNGTAVNSTESIDAGENARLIGPGRPMYVIVSPATVAADTTVTIQTSDSATFASGVVSVGSLFVPTGAKGVYSVGFPYTNLRYIRLQYNGEGTFTSHLSDQEPQSWKAYPAPSQA